MTESKGIDIAISRGSRTGQDEPQICISFRRAAAKGHVRFDAWLSLEAFARVITGAGGIECVITGEEFPGEQ